MVHAMRIGWGLAVLAVAGGLFSLGVVLSRSNDPQQRARWMQSQIERVRGLQFKRDVVIQEQSREELQRRAKAQLQEMSAPEHEQVLRTLGLLTSDETLDSEAVRKQIESNDAAIAYEPYSGRLLVVKGSNPRQGGASLDDLYAQEFYRALLDQHFDLKTYLERRPRDGALNRDEWLARYMVVEGEAFYGAVLRRAKQETGQVPEYFPLDEALDRHARTEQLVDSLLDPRLRDSTNSGRKPTRDPDGAPRFLTQLPRSMQRDGVSFAHAVRERGVDELGKLYTSSPPVSTEQVLHPQKWFVHERPLKIQWPAFDTDPVLADWELVEQDVLGELMIRTVFRVHYLSPIMSSAPAGWNGDRYAVFKRRGSGDMLLLLYTAWDTEAAAAAFAESYRVVVKEKYVEDSQPVRIVEEGRRVVIVEGGDPSSLDALMKFAQSAREIEDTALER